MNPKCLERSSASLEITYSVASRVGGAGRQEAQGYLLPTGVAASKALLSPQEAAWQALGMADDISALPTPTPASFHWRRRDRNLGGGVLREHNQVSTDGLLVEA